MAHIPPSNLVRRWERETMTLTGWNCQQGHEHATAHDAQICDELHAALKAMEATVQAEHDERIRLDERLKMANLRIADLEAALHDLLEQVTA